VSHDLDVLAARPYKLTDCGVEFSRPLNAIEFHSLGRLLSKMGNATPWLVGDWLLAGTSIWNNGERYRVALEITGQTFQRLGQYVRVAGSYQLDERDLAPWLYYRAALLLPQADRLAALQHAVRKGWELSTFADHIRRQRPASTRAIARPLVTCPECGWRFPWPRA